MTRFLHLTNADDNSTSSNRTNETENELSESEAETVIETETETKTETASETETVAETETVTETETEHETETNSWTEYETASEQTNNEFEAPVTPTSAESHAVSPSTPEPVARGMVLATEAAGLHVEALVPLETRPSGGAQSELRPAESDYDSAGAEAGSSSDAETEQQEPAVDMFEQLQRKDIYSHARAMVRVRGRATAACPLW